MCGGSVNFGFKSGQAVSRLCGILLSLSFLVLSGAMIFTFEKAAQFTAEAKYEEEVAQVVGADLQSLVIGGAEPFEEDAAPNTKSHPESAKNLDTSLATHL